MSGTATTRRLLGLTQLVGLATAGWSLLAPGPAAVLRDWSGLTIYPAWTVLVLAMGTVAAVVTVAAPALHRAAVAAAGGVTGVCAAQVAGLGAWAHRHWEPAFGMGGGYAGDPPRLEQLALLVAAGGAVAAVAAVAQLVVASEWPRSTPWAARAPRVVVGLVVLGGVPAGLAALDAGLADRTSLGAFALVHGVPWGLACVAVGWAARAAALGVLAAAAAGAGAAVVAPSAALTHGQGEPVFAAVVVLLVLAVLLEVGRGRRRRAPAPPAPRVG